MEVTAPAAAGLEAPSADPALAVRCRRSARGDAAALCAVALVWLAVWLPRLQGPIDLRWDASVYYVLGTSLAQGQGYRLLNEPGRIEAIQYPPGLPLLVAAHERLLGTTDYLDVAPVLRLTYFTLSGLYLLAAYALVRRYLGPALAAAACAMTALSFYSFLHPSDTLYAEIPFALVSTVFLLSHRNSRGKAMVVVTGLLGAAAFLLRTAGIALLAAWVGESLLARRWRQAALRAAVAALPVLLWQAHVWRVTSGPEYSHPAYPYQRAAYAYSNVSYAENSWLVDPFRPELGRTRPGDLPERALRNLPEIPRALGESSWAAMTSVLWLEDKLHRRLGLPELPRPVVSSAVAAVGWAILAGAALFAFHRRRTEREGCLGEPSVAATPAAAPRTARPETFIVLYFALTISLILLTPWPGQFWRYLAPLTPLSALFLATFLRTPAVKLAQRGRSAARAARLLVVAPWIALLVLQAVFAYLFLSSLQPASYYDRQGVERRYRLLNYGPEWRSLEPALEWLRGHATPEDVVATTVPHLAYLRTGIRAVLPPMETDPELARRLLAAVPVRYVLIDELGKPGVSERYAAPAVLGRPEEWKRIYVSPGGGAEVYEHLR